MYSQTKVPSTIPGPLQGTAATVPKFVRNLLHVVLPSFLIKLVKNTQHSEHSKCQSRKIASLDGLRGIACLFVFHAHYAYSFSNCLEEAGSDVLKGRIMYQPYISLLWSGIGMVNIFFFVSGYVLVGKSLRQIRSNEVSAAFSTISSAVFRRALRLYIPSMALIMMTAAMAHLHLFDAGSNFYRQTHQGNIGPQEAPPPRLGSLLAQFYDGLKDCYRMLDNTVPWGKFNFPYESDDRARPAGISHDKHLWTIPVEFRCSMLIFMILISTARIRSNWRMLIHIAFAFNCLFSERFPETLFIAGMVFAEIDIVSERISMESNQEIPSGTQYSQSLSIEGKSGRKSDWRLLPTNKRLGHMGGLVIFMLGLFLLSVPPQDAFGYVAYRPVLSLLPVYIEEKDDFVRVIGAIMTTWPVATSPIIAPLFCNPVAQYLGQISFALYLVHGAIIKSMWYWLQPSVNNFVSGVPVWEMPNGQFIRFWILGYMIVLPVVLWSADVFWRLIDQRSVSLARWVEEQLTRF
jgi:peptidoglycan/LPS O-acetylase OafA/YrhL